MLPAYQSMPEHFGSLAFAAVKSLVSNLGHHPAARHAACHLKRSRNPLMKLEIDKISSLTPVVLGTRRASKIHEPVPPHREAAVCIDLGNGR